jgi:hypothetical protein
MVCVMLGVQEPDALSVLALEPVPVALDEGEPVALDEPEPVTLLELVPVTLTELVAEAVGLPLLAGDAVSATLVTVADGGVVALTVVVGSWLHSYTTAKTLCTPSHGSPRRASGCSMQAGRPTHSDVAYSSEPAAWHQPIA